MNKKSWLVILIVVLISIFIFANNQEEVGFGPERGKSPIQITHYNTGDSSELVTSLPITIGGSSYEKRVIYSQRLSDLQQGEILIVLSEFEVTHEESYFTLVGSQLVLSNSEDSIVGKEISEANARNLDNQIHHITRTSTGTYFVTSGDTGTKYVNLVAYSAANSASPGDTIKVEQDYGRLSVIRIG